MSVSLNMFYRNVNTRWDTRLCIYMWRMLNRTWPPLTFTLKCFHRINYVFYQSGFDIHAISSFWVGLNSFTLCARQRLAFWDVCGPRCIYRWLYQLIGGLQHVDSTQDPNPHWKGSVPAHGIFCINPILDLPDPAPTSPLFPTSGLLGLINVILHFRSSLLCFIADTLDFNYKNAALRCDQK